MKSIVQIFLFLAFSVTSGFSVAEEPFLAPPSLASFMTYQVDGVHVSLDRANVVLVQGDAGYKIDGNSTIQGNVDVVVILIDEGSPAVGTYTTGAREVVFMLGLPEDESRMTLDLANQSFGEGVLRISEVTDTYVKGTFSFIADAGSEDGPDLSWDVTNGIFKAEITQF